MRRFFFTAMCWILGTVASASPRPPSPGISHLGPVPKRPVRRVVTLAPSLTDTVVALGAQQTLVGVSRFDEAPEVASLPRVGGFVDPSVEAVLRLKPDLVLVQPGPGNRRPVEKLAELGVSILLLPLHSVEDTLASLRAVGKALGKEAQAEARVAQIQASRKRVRAAAQRQLPVSVLFVYGFSPLVVAGPGSFADELLRDAGARNVASDTRQAYVVYSVERAVREKPEVVVDAADVDAGKEHLRALPGLRQARWVELPSKALLQPGPSLGVGLEQLFLQLYPKGALTP